MNILIFNWRDLKHSWAGGGEIYVFEMAKRWVKAGHKVTVFCGQDPYQKLKDEEVYDGIRIVRKGGRFSLYLWAPIFYFKHFRKKTDVIIDVQNGIPFFSTLFSRRPKVAFVYHVHDRQFFYELLFPLSLVGYLIERFIFPLFYRHVPIIAISKTTKQELIKLGFRDKKIHIVYCGINGSRVKEHSARKKFSSPTLLYLGRIKAYKRVDLLVEIFSEILKTNPSTKLIIAGWGTEASSVTDKVMRSSFRRRIEVMGPVSESEKKRLLSQSWLFVNPSIGEGWSIAVIESNLHGTPAIGFKVTGLTESIKNGKTGLLAKDKADMIKKINKVLSDKPYREKMGENARKWAKTFSWDSASMQSLNIFKNLVQINKKFK
jgi:glycosyltransferase involved in cell wall biosynthesis